MEAAFIFPAVKGFQANHEYFISMVPLEIIPRIFQFSDDELPPEIRAQRVLNKARVPEIRDYILDNPDSYVFSSLTVSVDGDMAFTSISDQEPMIGHIKISMNAQFLINDGQHRRAAISEAIKKKPALKNEHISVVFYHDQGLRHSQQMFSDLNRYAIRPTRSINILFNSREESSIIAKEVSERVYVFRGLIEKEKTAISNRSKALFTLSAICTSTEQLLDDLEMDAQEKIEFAVEFWESAARHMKEWVAVKEGRLKSSDVRKEYICSLGITLTAIGYAGNALFKRDQNGWKSALTGLDEINWKKDNPIWEGLIFANGRVAANRANQQAMSHYIANLLMNN